MVKKARKVGLFGAWLRRCRLSRKLTCEKLASMTGTHKGYISGIENGVVNPPSVKIALRLISKLGWRENRSLVLMMAWVDKAPEQIREEVRSRIFTTVKGVR
jgi:transcriptional regulator with XRE-family HTH domain